MGIITFLQLTLQQPKKPLNNLIKMKVLAVLSICAIGLTSAAPGWHHKQWRYQQWKPVKSHHMAKAAPAPRVAELPSIAAAAIATPSLSTLVTAVKAAGLVETLSGEGT